MTTTQHGPESGSAHAAGGTPHGGAVVPDIEEWRQLSLEEQMVIGAASQGVHIVHRRSRFPIPGTKAEKRAERAVASMFLLAALAGVGFIVAFIALPYKWTGPSTGQNFSFYTPVLGALLGVMLVAIGFGAVLWAKWLLAAE